VTIALLLCLAGWSQWEWMERFRVGRVRPCTTSSLRASRGGPGGVRWEWMERFRVGRVRPCIDLLAPRVPWRSRRCAMGVDGTVSRGTGPALGAEPWGRRVRLAHRRARAAWRTRARNSAPAQRRLSAGARASCAAITAGARPPESVQRARNGDTAAGEPVSEPGHGAKRRWPGEFGEPAAAGAVERARPWDQLRARGSGTGGSERRRVGAPLGGSPRRPSTILVTPVPGTRKGQGPGERPSPVRSAATRY